MPLRDRGKKRKRLATGLFRRYDKRCQRCGRKIKMGRYCYWCGKYLGLW